MKKWSFKEILSWMMSLFKNLFHSHTQQSENIIVSITKESNSYSTNSEKNVKMTEEKLAIIIGHSDDNAGASMAFPYDYIQEYEYNTVLAGIIQAIANDRKIKCKVILRDGFSIAQAYAQALEYGPSAIVELHFNSFSESKVKGTETLCGHIAGSYDLALKVHDQICQVLGRSLNGGGDRGVKLKDLSDRGGRNVNNGTEIPSILIEPFFGSSRSDSYLGLYYMRDIAESILVGFLDFMYGDPDSPIH